MAKKLQDGHQSSKPVDALEIKQRRNSNAYERVLKHNTFEGFYLSKYQLFELGNELMKMEGSPEGIWFAIGETKVNSRKVRTVETIPYKIINGFTGELKLYESKGIVADFKIRLGNLEIDNNQSAKFDNNTTAKRVENQSGDGSDSGQTNTLPGGPSSSQRTPPPKIEP